jgi:hypothetical protein
MFFDKAIPPQNVQDHFNKKIKLIIKGLDALSLSKPNTAVLIHNATYPCIRKESSNLVIFHPPYFNLYKYSSIYKYEMLWLGYDNALTRLSEVREGFKIGKKELVVEYIKDIIVVLNNMSNILVSGGWCVLMIGDTTLRDERINVTSMILKHLLAENSDLQLKKIIIRHPKYTEASYAATQRRAKDLVAVKMPDHLIVFQKK